MVGNRPMSREEFERLRAMNGLARGGGAPGAGPLGPGMGPGLPLLVDPSTVAAALGGILPFDHHSAALPRPGPAANGLLPGGGGLGAAGRLDALLPGPMVGGQVRRPGQQQQQPQQQQSMPLGGGGGPWLAGGSVNGRAAIPLPRPPPGQPVGSRTQGLDGGGAGLRALAGGLAGPESPANRHALHVWERDSHAGGLPPPPQGFGQQQHQQKQQTAGPRPPQPQPTAEELAKRKADMVCTARSSLHVVWMGARWG